MNSAAELFNKAVQFKVVEGNRIVIKVVDVTTDEVLREFPPERCWRRCWRWSGPSAC